MAAMPDLVIRAVTPRDLEDITALAGSRDRAIVRLRAAERGAESTAVAVSEAQPVGVVSVRWRTGCDPPHPWLYGLHVAARVRRRGVGRGLVRYAEAECGRRGADHLSLDVDVDDAEAITFYEALGYAVVRRHQHRWRSLDPQSGAVTAEGTAPTFIMRRALGG
jgi:ribosomal protein S18 acetylase RimI-like enzyme